jgi:altronate hydrolase
MKGYLRKDGRKGIRNVIVVTYLVECAHHVAEQISRQTDTSEMPVHLIGFGGCAPNIYAQFIMERLCTHPNVGGVVIVSLGCENFLRDQLLQRVRQSGREGALIVIQEEGGTRTSIQKGIEAIRTMTPRVQGVPRVELHWSDLCVGTVCGGSDACSGITANPTVGQCFDTLVDAGATCIFEEPGELIGCEALLRQRGATHEVGKQLYDCIHKADVYYKKMGHDSFSQGNAVGGLTTIEEKSLGSYSKSGSRTIQGLIRPGEIPSAPGLYMMDVVPDGEARWGFPNVSDTAEIVEMMASGCHMVLYTTGRGSVAGSAISPVIKVCSNPITYSHLSEDMDINAGRIISEGASLSDCSSELLSLIEQVANGTPTRSESLGHREFFLGYKDFQYHCPLA